MKTSLNNSMFVKLNEMGLEIWKAHYNSYLPEPEHYSTDYFKSKENEDGFTEFQIWEFANIFGKYLYNGSIPIMQTGIIIK